MNDKITLICTGVFILFFFPAIILLANDYRRVFHFAWNGNSVEDQTTGSNGEVKEGLIIISRFGMIIATHIIYFIGFILFPIFVFFPNSIFNKVIVRLWGKYNIKNGREIEPAILDAKKQEERRIQ